MNPERKIRMGRNAGKARENNGLMEWVLVTFWVSAFVPAGC